MHCSQCGTELPENARFCLNCGAPAQPILETPSAPGPANTTLDFLQPALAGGMFLGLLSSIPIIQAGNCLCCMWVLGGGGLAAYMLMQQRSTGGVSFGDGAFAGVMSGLIGAVVATLISIPTKLFMSRFLAGQQSAMEEALREYPIDEATRELLLRMASPEVSVVTILPTFIMNLIIFSLFAMIGGILTVAIVNNQRARARTERP